MNSFSKETHHLSLVSLHRWPKDFLSPSKTLLHSHLTSLVCSFPFSLFSSKMSLAHYLSPYLYLSINLFLHFSPTIFFPFHFQVHALYFPRSISLTFAHFLFLALFHSASHPLSINIWIMTFLHFFITHTLSLHRTLVSSLPFSCFLFYPSTFSHALSFLIPLSQSLSSSLSLSLSLLFFVFV